MVKRVEPTAKKGQPKKHNQSGKINSLRTKLQHQVRNRKTSLIKEGDEKKKKKEQELKQQAKTATLAAVIKSGSPVLISPTTSPHKGSQQDQFQPVTTEKQFVKRIQVQHVRTAWYMTAVDGVSPSGPTATGSLPKEYQFNKYFIPPPDSPDAIQGLPSKFKILTSSLNKLSDADRKRAEELLGVKMPPPNRYFAKVPRIFYFYASRLKDLSPFKKFKLHRSEQQAFTKPKLAVTAFSLNQIPRLRHHTRDVEIVFVGRSNVGKSSLINAITNSDLAKAGRTPGKTQSLNFYALHPEALRRHRGTASALARSSQIDTDRIFSFVQKLDPALTIPATDTQLRTTNDAFKKAGNGPVMFLVDVPGYGHADAPDWIVDKWNVMLGSYLRLRSPLNFPLDPMEHWTTKEYIQLLLELKKNQAQPRRKREKKVKFQLKKGDQAAATPTDDDDDDEVDGDDFGDDDNGVQDGNELSDYENDSMILFQQALDSHIETVKNDMEKRLANTEYIMEQLKKLENLEDALSRGDASVDIDMIRIQRDALIDLQLRLNASISSNPLNSTVTNLPSNLVSQQHHNDHNDALDMEYQDKTSTPFAQNRALLRKPVSKAAIGVKRIIPKYNLHAAALTAAASAAPDVTAGQPDSTEESTSEDTQASEGRYEDDDDGDEYESGSEQANDDELEPGKNPLDTYARYKTLQKELQNTSIRPIQSRLPPLDHLGEFHGSPLKNVVVLLDARSGVTKYDIQFLNFLEKYRITHQVVLTKIDKMTTEQLEGAAFSVAQSLFPHEYVKVLQKTQPLELAAFPDGKLPKNSPSFTVRSPEQDRLWVQSRKLAPRKFCSPLLLGVSAEKNINIDVLRKSILHNVLDRM